MPMHILSQDVCIHKQIHQTRVPCKWRESTCRNGLWPIASSSGLKNKILFNVYVYDNNNIRETETLYYNLMTNTHTYVQVPWIQAHNL